MIALPNYPVLTQIYESSNSIVYRGFRESDNLPVILKVLKQDYPTPQELTRYKQEYQITHNLNLEGTVKAYDLLPYQKTLIIILEDFNALSLKQLAIEAGTKAFFLSGFFKIAIQITDHLGEIHKNNIIHKDINPANIVFNPETGQLKIIDFGISTQFSQENPTLKNPNVLEGTLAYISPEQTGRMNRSLDYRTDFYSLGVTFYELLTGQLPFKAEDALELVHCHIAKVPISPHQVNADIPEALSELVMKLLAKTAEERYQSAWGIKADLEKCFSQLKTTGKIDSFPLATQDITDQFKIPQKLYGREKEVETLLAAFERVAGEDTHPSFLTTGKLKAPLSQEALGISHTELMLIGGYSGIGKSALVAEVHKPITKKRGYFISGKFDQFQRNIPYSAVVTAFKDLVRQLLTESEVQLNHWREKLLGALGVNGQIIIDVIPEVELIIGQQSFVPKLDPAESQNRFNLVFQNFIRVFCTKEHPLVIFLDDLQWVDSATLKLIKLMITDSETQYLFLIGAYRNNEVSSNHPLMMTMEEVKKEGATIEFIILAPLGLEPIIQMLVETLNKDIKSVRTLAQLILRKTGGNPFFINEFLKILYIKKLLTFDVANQTWTWDIATIETMAITDNVVDLMIGKLKTMPLGAQHFLRFAACIGSNFDLKTLSIICEESSIKIYHSLKAAVQAGLILPISELDENLLIQNYKFGHDRIQQASHALIDDEQKKIVHLHIGRMLLSNLSVKERTKKIFDIVDHLNIGRDLITDEQERFQLAELNLEAGKKAKNSTAYIAALAQYFTPGIEVLPGDSWKTHYKLTFNLSREKSECEYLCRHFDRAEESFNSILTQAKSDFERAEIHTIRMVLHENTGNYLETLSIGAESLKNFGFTLPTTNTAEILSEFQSELNLYRLNLEKIKITELINAPKMTNLKIKICMKILMKMLTSAYYSNQDLLALISLKITNISIEYGNSEESAYGYATWGIILGSRLVDYEASYAIGQVAMKLADQFNNSNLACKVLNAFGGLVSPWCKPLKQSIPLLRNGYLAGVETGSVDASTNSYNLILQKILSANNLSEIIQESNKHIDFLRKIKIYVFAEIQQMFQGFLLNLQGATQDQFSFSYEGFDEIQCVQRWQKSHFLTGVAPYNIFQTQVLFFYGDYEKALNKAKETQNSLIFVSGLPIQAEYYFYYSLTLTALYPTSSFSRQKEFCEILKINQQKMKIWANSCPENFLHKYLLVKAEIARISSKKIEVIWDLYERAISSAYENEYIQNEALGNELAAKFWLAKGKEEIAQVYLKKAHYGYQVWGAKRKVKDLETKYSHLLLSLSTNRNISSTSTQTTSSTTGSQEASEALDLATVMKASQTIGSEIELEKLLANLMKVLVQNAGAQTGFLLMNQAGQWVIEASGEVEVNKVTVLQSIPVERSFPISILNYVTRTGEIVVENDAAQAGNFILDPYIKANQTKSILCVPLLNQGQLNGIVYLENNLATGAFTPARSEVIQLLSGQAAIAIDNARLYDNLEHKVQERTQQLQDKNEELAITLEQLRTTQKQLVESEKMSALGGLVAGIAHEVNTPLGIGVAAASHLFDKTVSLIQAYRTGKMKKSQLEQFLDTSERSTQLLLEHLNQAAELIQSFKQVAVDQSSEAQRTFKFKKYLQAVVMSLQPKLQGTHHQIEIKGEESLTLESYPGAISQILTNFLTNSLTHAYDAGCIGKIQIEFEQDGDEVILKYTDNGKGIAPEHKEQIFNPFFTTARGQGGSGLGLHIVYNLVVQKLRGTIECESQLGVGTTFAIRFPGGMTSP